MERITNHAGTVCPACGRDDFHVRGSLKCEQLELLLARERLAAISRIVRRALACGQLEKLEDAKQYLEQET